VIELRVRHVAALFGIGLGTGLGVARSPRSSDQQQLAVGLPGL
jgi:hypothetical protein